MIIITHASTDAQVSAIQHLFREYEADLNINLDFQHFETELATLPGRYGPPAGALLLALDGEVAAGSVALRKLSAGICEMKRLFVRPSFRGRGLGRRLAWAIIATAKRRGYRTMRLDTLTRLTAASALYRSLGFVRITPYYKNPLPDVVYWELYLTGRSDKSQR